MKIEKFIKSNIIKLLVLLILITIYIYIIVIDNIPEVVTVFEGENFEIQTIFGIKINIEDKKQEAVLTSSILKETAEFSQKGKNTIEVSLFDKFKIKDIDINVIEKTTVIPIGELAGIKLYTEGVLVVGMSEIQGKDNNKYKPYINSGIEEGDVIIEINDNKINSTTELVESVNNSKGKALEITYSRNGESKECSITPVESQEGYKLGLWVRDSAAGIGTITLYEPKNNAFIALGHGITDIDTSELINISTGELVTTKILSVIKGKNGEPGKIQGTVEKQQNIGTIYKNTGFGIYGTIGNIQNLNYNSNRQMEVALRDEIKTGKATILCTVDQEQEAKEYEIEIEKIYKNNNYDNKSMLIKVTDEELLEKTGGIIQGMSGSPIIQNGKFCGAVTHVLVNDATQGYAVFGEILIKQLSNLGS